MEEVVTLNFAPIAELCLLPLQQLLITLTKNLLLWNMSPDSLRMPSQEFAQLISLRIICVSIKLSLC